MSYKILQGNILKIIIKITQKFKPICGENYHIKKSCPDDYNENNDKFCVGICEPKCSGGQCSPGVCPPNSTCRQGFGFD